MIQHSYDIFDTCLTRLCGDPKDIFILMAHKIFGKLCSDTLANDYRYMRVKAEINATIIHKDSTTLADIYEQLDFTTYTGLSNEQLIALELSTEELNLRPIKSTLDEIVKIHKDGGKIIYISDMYLPSDFLKGILEKFGFWNEFDSIYVSCECGATKNSGKLYDYVRKVEHLNKKKWMHHGDNKISDIQNPKRMGIKSLKIITDFSPIQKFLIGHNWSTTSHTVQLTTGIMRSLIYENRRSAANIFATDLIAPIYVPFVYCIMKDASLRKIKKLFFLARDGYIFYKIAEVFKRYFPGIEINYIYVSRKSLYLPSITEVNRETLQYLLVDTKHSNSKEQVDNLQVKFDDNFFKMLSDGQNPIDVVLNNKKYLKIIENKVAEQRKLLIQYFEQEGLASYNQESAIVDLRGTRNCQKCISSILESEGYTGVFGYYLEAVHNRICPNKRDDYRAFLFGDNIVTNPVFCGLRNIKDILEHYYSLTPFKRTSSYVEKDHIIKPVFDDDDLDSEQNHFIMDVNIRICIEMAERFLLLGLETKAEEILNLGFIGLSAFMRNPKTEYLEALVNVKASQTVHRKRNIVGKFTPSALLKHDITWIEGSIKYTFGSCGLFLYNISIPFLKRIYQWIK